VLRAKKEGTHAEVEALQEKYLYRMWDLSQFMKALKQRFTQWFNTRHERTGTLWEARFKSVIVEDGYAARVVAAYIDLNPIRAELVEKPEDYRWCSYAEALAGKAAARVGIERVMSEFEEYGGGRREAKSWRQVIAEYRVILFADGEERLQEDGQSGEVKIARRGIPPAEADQTRASGGKLNIGQMLRIRIRHFVDGAAIGGKAFLEEVFRANRGRFSAQRKSGARKIRGCNTSLRSLRDLQDGVG
jgi:hypothetical protein